jgi:ketosteroid isomerase-like protein
MKPSILRTIALLAIVCWSANAAFSQSNADLKAKIEKINMDMKKAMLSGDNASNLKYYTKDAISMPSYEPMHDGIEAIRKSNEEMAKSGWKVTAFEPTTLKVNSSGNLVTEVGTYKITFKGPMDGKEVSMDDVGKYLTVYEVQADKSLKIKIETWNSDMNPMMKDQK